FVTSAARPSINHPGLLSDTERDRGQAYHFEYPRSSLQSLCRLWVGYRGDPLLAGKWVFAGSRFDCEWN
ncbi:MAG: hypothetical protein HY901_35840, partial [Deltaproteobacteria bacterium]|nr:hypothetical protein [Deltaproteobacteria bacterium]